MSAPTTPAMPSIGACAQVEMFRVTNGSGWCLDGDSPVFKLPLQQHPRWMLWHGIAATAALHARGSASACKVAHLRFNRGHQPLQQRLQELACGGELQRDARPAGQAG